jgi:hypothetical protein
MAVPSHSRNAWALPKKSLVSRSKNVSVACETCDARNEARRVCRAIAPPYRNTKRRRLTTFSVRSMELRDGDRIGSRSPALRRLHVEAFAAPIDQGRGDGTLAMAHIQDKAAG